MLSSQNWVAVPPGRCASKQSGAASASRSTSYCCATKLNGSQAHEKACLSLHRSATLPPTLWVANGNGSGPPSLQRLQSFNASAAGLQGALPSWGAPDVLPPGQAPTLTELILGYNPGLAGATEPGPAATWYFDQGVVSCCRAYCCRFVGQ